MRYRASGLTRGTLMAMFWPQLLPGDFSEKFAKERLPLLEQLSEAGKLILFPWKGGPCCLLTVFVDEEVPAELLSACGDAVSTQAVEINGQAYFGGSEHISATGMTMVNMFVGDGSPLPPMDFPAGRYVATTYKLSPEMNQTMHARWVDERSGVPARKTLEMVDSLGTGAASLVVAFAFCVCFVPWSVSVGLALAAIVLITWIIRLRSSQMYRDARTVSYSFYEAAASNFVLHLRPKRADE